LFDSSSLDLFEGTTDWGLKGNEGVFDRACWCWNWGFENCAGWFIMLGSKELLSEKPFSGADQPFIIGN
jgi:hypothetical protein